MEHLTFSGEYAIERGQRILYITERAVFEIEGDGLRLIEIAPGIDLQADVLDHMRFTPRISETLVTMDAALFCD